MNKEIDIYAIIKDENENKVKCIFTEKGYTEAKIWFQGYLIGEKHPLKYTLYKIGTIDKNMKIKGYKIYVANGQTITKTENEIKYEQFKLIKEEKQKIENIKKLYKEGATMADIISRTFEGSIINERR